MEGNPEAEWAHIKSVEDNSPDHIGNGLALCRFHHWAFDAGLFSISDDYRVLINKNLPEKGDYDNIVKFEGKKIFIPKEIKPDIKFLKYHRNIHGF